MSTIFDAQILQLTDRLNLLRDSLNSPLMNQADKRRLKNQIQTTKSVLYQAIESKRAQIEHKPPPQDETKSPKRN